MPSYFKSLEEELTTADKINHFLNFVINMCVILLIFSDTVAPERSREPVSYARQPAGYGKKLRFSLAFQFSLTLIIMNL